ncbi:hypothetical protein FBEOM_6189 [Fusarium beomiforme]|uniref:Uncharacterized protein n=1 Tax=Fusarium beomiforme TaxID=44412 RepID=A0A9P5AJI2_9HYPO|nr:hypothetical protein FBEOM_6189 [Fusarium beomiforme]
MPSSSTIRAWFPATKSIIDIGGSTLNRSFDDQLDDAFEGKSFFPKERPNFVPYINTFLDQGKPCIHFALDIFQKLLIQHINEAATDFPDIICVGLWGNLAQSYEFFEAQPSPLLFLSLGSNFINATEIPSGNVASSHWTASQFSSWKRDDKEVHELAEAQGLAIATLGEAPNSGMRKYVIQPGV